MRPQRGPVPERKTCLEHVRCQPPPGSGVILLVTAVSVLAFILAFKFTGLVPKAREVIATSGRAAAAMADSSLDDDAKEAAVRRASLALFGGFGAILVRAALTLLAAWVPIQLADRAGLIPADAVMGFMMRLDVILATTVIVIALVWIYARLRPRPAGEAPESAYSGVDQMVHNLAFGAKGLQLSMAEMEDRRFRKRLEGIETDRPVFITSLPRAGTTILLTALAHMPGLATHLYRDMPFVMAPMLWARLSRSFRKQGAMAERAHGDGIEVGFDSPEAFEEVIWKAFWPGHYRADRITLWDAADRNPEGEAFLRRHMAKIIALRCETTRGARYISKNNGNVARIPLLQALFPEGRIVVPVRDPLSHAASLLRQHENFLRQHGEDDFVRRYMADIGHYEFGALHRPIAFPDFPRLLEALPEARRRPAHLDYWMAYWVAAFRHLQAQQGLIFIGHEAVRAHPRAVMGDLCERIGLAPGPHMDEIVAEFSPVRDRPVAHDLPPDLLDEARALHARLAGDPA